MLKNVYAEIVESTTGLIKLQLDGLEGTNIHGHVNQLLVSGKNIALVDIDGTLRDCKDRVHLLPSKEFVASEEYKLNPNGAYKDFHLACGDDTPFLEMIKTIQGLKATGYTIILLTSCTAYPETIEATLNQMNDWGVGQTTMIMRHPDNHFEPTEMKMNFIKELVTHSSTVGQVLLVDDNKGTIDAAKDYGLQTLLAVS